MSEIDGVTSVSVPMPIGETVASEQGAPPTPEVTTEAAAPVAEPVVETAPPVVEEAPTEEAPETLEIQEQAKSILEQAGLDMTAMSAEFAESGILSEDTYTQLDTAGFPRDLVENYIAGAKAVSANNAAMVKRAAYDTIGGEANYTLATQWAAANLDAPAIAAFNNAVASNDEATIKLAVGGLNAQYTSSVGSEGVQVQGSAAPASASSDVFASKADMMSSLSSHEYRTSPAFRQSVDSKVARSLSAHGGNIPR